VLLRVAAYAYAYDLVEPVRLTCYCASRLTLTLTTWWSQCA
jgi:hypothetical protein